MRLLLLLLALAGCSPTRSEVDQRLMDDRGPGARDVGVADNYLVGCPDVLEVTVEGPSGSAFRGAVGVDGCVDLGDLGRPRVEGRTVPAVAALVAERAGVPAGQVAVRVAEFHSEQVYLFGEVNGVQRAVPYRGQETVLDLLQRTGLKAGAAPDDVYVIRPHLVEGTRPEVFHVDLRAIVLKHDQSTNLRLQPFDQVHVGETHRSKLDHCVPPWLRSLYQSLFGGPAPAGP